MLGIGIGVDWNNKKVSGGPPTIYSFIVYECDGIPLGEVYSLSNSFTVGNYIYSAPDLTFPYNGYVSDSDVATSLNYVNNGLITATVVICG